MKRRLLLAAVLFSTGFTFAQTFENRASNWIKPDRTLNKKQALNQNVVFNKNVTQSLTSSIGEGDSNFYVVFKSEDATETALLDFTFTCNQHSVTTHNINYPDSNLIDLKRRTGAIVKYGFSFPNAAGDKNFVTIADNPNDLTDVYEMIYVNDTFTELDHQQIQTYLSLKYGISLINHNNYVDQNGKAIWNSNLNNAYNHYITGTGRSDYFGLNKTVTSNSIDKRLEVSTNRFENNEYLMIGTNTKHSNWINEGQSELLDTSWLVQTNASSNLTTLRFNSDTKLKDTGTYELLVHPTASSFVVDENIIRYQGKVEGNQIVFPNVVFDTDRNGFDTFSIAYSSQSKETTQPKLVISSDVNAYPNPANLNESVKVTYRFDKPTNLNIHVFTIDGKFIEKKEVNNTTGYEYETSFNAAGVYLIVSTYNGQVTTNRLIVK